MHSRNIGISWQLSDRHGWGIFGYHIAIYLIMKGPCPPLLITNPNFIGIPEEIANEIRSYFRETPNLKRTTMFHSLGNNFQENKISSGFRGRKNIAFAFFENTIRDQAAIERAKSWDRLLVGSSWNRDICLNLGITNTTFISQGVDLNSFYPSTKQGLPSKRFVIYSGGKLEYRKGQDLVLTAFKIFNERHPDSLLVTAWQNSWAESAMSITKSKHINFAPEMDKQGSIAMMKWVIDNGLPADSFVDLGWVSNARLPIILREADIAMFPSRAEGGTNLSAMEAMACGIPCILTANTGHLDLIDTDNCYALTDLKPDPVELGFWCQAGVEEIVAKLEHAYTNTEDRKHRAEQGAKTMKKLSWENQIGKLIDAIQGFL
jgi:glycosyltransferase involved in cell wall biosynthesis